MRVSLRHGIVTNMSTFRHRIVQGLDRSAYWWIRYNQKIYAVMLYTLAFFALVKLGDEFIRLLFEYHEKSAVDLKLFMALTRDWFAGIPVYQVHKFAVYPPATHTILFPIFGPFSLTTTRILWAVINAGLLVWLASYAVRAAMVSDQHRQVQWFLALTPLAMNATGVVIGNGQLTIAVMMLLVISLRLSNKPKGSAMHQLAAGSMFFLALAKPSLAIPFFWILLFSSTSLISGFTAAILYSITTLFAAQFQEANLPNLIAGWLDRAFQIDFGYANLHAWLQSIDMKHFLLPLQIVVLSLLGIWVYRYRRIPQLLLLGVAGLVSRFWTYHAVYDDLIVLFAILALFRYAQSVQEHLKHAFLLEWLAVINVLALLLPARMRYWPQPFEFLFKGGHVLIWIVDLIVLLFLARMEKNLKDPIAGLVN